MVSNVNMEIKACLRRMTNKRDDAALTRILHHMKDRELFERHMHERRVAEQNKRAMESVTKWRKGDEELFSNKGIH